MYLDDFLKLATDFNLIPLISKKDMYGIFKSCLSNADTESLSYQKVSIYTVSTLDTKCKIV